MAQTEEQQLEGGGVVKYLQETRSEMEKVVWPTREESYNLTVVVLIVTVIIMMMIFAIDAFYREVIEVVFSVFG